MAAMCKMTYCNPIFEHPVEHLFKAIRILQTLEECDTEVQSLRTKLQECFKDIPVRKEGYKYCNWYRYYPSGLIQFSTDTNLNLSLDPYEHEVVETKTIEQSIISVCMEVLRNLYLPKSVYWQVRDYLGILKVTEKLDFQVMLRQIAEYNALPEESKACLKFDAERLKEKAVTDLVKNFTKNRYNEPTNLNFLTKAQLENLIVGLKLRYNTDDIWQFARDFFQSKQDSHDRDKWYDIYEISIPVTYVLPENEKGNYPRGYYDRTAQHPFDQIYSQLLTITEPTAVSVLSRIGAIPKVRKPRVKKSKPIIEEVQTA